MNNADEKWQWVDEDPIEKLLHPRSDDHRQEPDSRGPVASTFLATGQAQFDSLRFEEAAGSYSAAVAAEPENPAAHYGLAVCLEKIDQWKAAANSFRRTLELDPERLEALAGLGACLLHLELIEEALSCFELARESGADPEPALLGEAVALHKLNRYEDADRVYREHLQINPNSAETLANLIALSVARQDTVAVFEFARRLLRVNPRSKAALQGLATLAIRHGDQSGAVDYCTRLVEVDPDSFEGWFNLRFAQQRMRPPGEPTRSIA